VPVDGKPGPLAHLLMTLITLAGVALIMWMESPEWQRQMIARTTRARARRFAALVAARSGHQSMGSELSGRTIEAEAGYGITYRLSRLRDRL
jgi:hypothetical protein